MSSNEDNTPEGYIVVEPGLGVNLRVLGEDGQYVDWSIVAEERSGVGAIKLLCNGGRVEKRVIHPRIALYPSSNNSITIKGVK